MNYFLNIFVDISEKSLTYEFYQLLKEYWSGNASELSPNSFKDRLGTIHEQFSGFHQHDGQEFLALLLDTLHTELNSAQLKKQEKVENVTQEIEEKTPKEVCRAISTDGSSDSAFLSAGSNDSALDTAALEDAKSMLKWKMLKLENPQVENALLKSSSLSKSTLSQIENAKSDTKSSTSTRKRQSSGSAAETFPINSTPASPESNSSVNLPIQNLNVQETTENTNLEESKVKKFTQPAKVRIIIKGV